jgi:hypothetical protein
MASVLGSPFPPSFTQSIDLWRLCPASCLPHVRALPPPRSSVAPCAPSTSPCQEAPTQARRTRCSPAPHALLQTPPPRGTGPLGATYLSSLSCRSMDPAAAVVHPLPHDARGGYSCKSWSGGAALPSLTCRSMDKACCVRTYDV